MGDLISRAYVLAEYDRQHKSQPGGARKIMEDVPAVDAVPVEWIQAQVKNEKRAPLFRRYAEALLTIWQMEQEAQDG